MLFPAQEIQGVVNFYWICTAAPVNAMVTFLEVYDKLSNQMKAQAIKDVYGWQCLKIQSNCMVQIRTITHTNSLNSSMSVLIMLNEQRCFQGKRNKYFKF